MDGVLNVLAMIVGLLVLGWLVGSGDESTKDARTREEPPPEHDGARAEQHSDQTEMPTRPA